MPSSRALLISGVSAISVLTGLAMVFLHGHTFADSRNPVLHIHFAAKPPAAHTGRKSSVPVAGKNEIKNASGSMATAEDSIVGELGENTRTSTGTSAGESGKRHSFVEPAKSGKAAVTPRTPEMYGPPLPAERVANARHARALLAALREGCLALTMPERDREQLVRLERDGIYCWTTPTVNMNLRSSRQHDALEGTLRIEEDAPQTTSPRNWRLSSRSATGLLRPMISVPNPADAPDFDPCRNPPSPMLLRMLATLAAHATPRRPLEILSLLRPPYRTGGFVHVGSANPHSLGLAADIASYGGYTVRTSRKEDCVRAMLALLRDLPPGRYRLGVPKAPELPLVVGRPPLTSGMAALLHDLVPESAALGAKEDGTTSCLTAAAIGAFAAEPPPAPAPLWAFFPAPEPEIVNGMIVGSHDGKMMPNIVRYLNEGYAPEADLHDPRLRTALTAARNRGVDIVAMFPDGADHIHIDVRQMP